MILEQWISTMIFLGVLRTVNVQYAVPMYQPPPPMMMMAPPPPPVAVPMPYPVPVPVIVTKKPTTTTTERPHDDSDTGAFMPIPLPFGFPMPFVIPQGLPPKSCANRPRSENCPPCPPCMCAPRCTPSFYSYCSTCHQKCRCKGKDKDPEKTPPKPPQPIPLALAAPMPMPMYPMAPAPPVFAIPLPPFARRPSFDRSSSSDTDSDSTSSSESSDSDRWRGRRRRRYKKKTRNARRARSSETHDNRRKFKNDHNSKLVKPILSYISEKGEVKFQKKISEDDAERLMRDTDRSRSVENSRRSGSQNSRGLKKDRRKVIFSSPANKSITNLTVSFDVV